MLYKATAPGSLMLMGEYAVLSANPAIVGAIDKFIQVTINPRQDHLINIQSVLGQHTTTISNIEIQAPFEYVLTALTLMNKLPSGCDIFIEGNCESGIGLGSSAAVTIATFIAINLWLKQKDIPQEQLWQQAMLVIQRVQGKGSGADLAASIYGGVIVFQNNPFRIERLASTLPICAIYSGNKLKTAQAINLVSQRHQQQPHFLTAINKAITQLTNTAILSIKNQDWQTLGLLFNQAQTNMISLGVSNELLNSMITTLRDHPQIFGAKISGSGLGDCVIGLGDLPKNIFPLDSWQQQWGVRKIPLAITALGATIG